MAYTVDLGSDTFYSTKLDLDLTLYTSVEILVPANATGVRSAEGLKNTLYSGTIWVDQLPQLRLNVYVSAESTLNHPLTILASQMGDALCNSQCWLELGLGILFKSCDNWTENTTSTVFHLSFGLRRRLGGPVTAKITRRPAMIKSLSNAIPPLYIPTFHISTINITMIYSCQTQSKLQDISSTSTATTNLFKLLHLPDYWVPEVLNIDPHGLYRQVSDTAAPENSMGGAYRVDKVAGHSQESASSSILLANDICQVSEFISLFNIGFSTLVRDNPPRIYKYPTLKKSELHSLSRIAPSVFSLRYSEAMNERSQLIPIIAKSLCSILKSTRNRLLQDKVATLELLQRHRLEGLCAVPDVMDLKTTIMTSLWRIAQTKLYKPEASRRLSPLWPVTRPSNVFPLQGDIVTKEYIEESIQFPDDWDIDETETSDDYLGTNRDIDSYGADETSILLSHGENISVYSDIMENQSSQFDCLEDSGTISNPPWETDRCRPCGPTASPFYVDSLSDDEMFASDPFDDCVTSTSIPISHMSSVGEVNGSYGRGSDDMLCD